MAIPAFERFTQPHRLARIRRRDPNMVSTPELVNYIQILEQACIDDPGSADLRTCLGMAYAMNNQADLSMGAFETAIRLDPQHFFARFRCAELQYRMCALSRAEEETRKALKLARNRWQTSMAKRQLQEIRGAIRISCAVHRFGFGLGKRPRKPTAKTPHNPPTAWTGMAPPGSSTCRRDSSHSTQKGIIRPATRPTITAAAGGKNAHPALPAASPPIHPFAVSDASGFPKRMRVTSAAASADAPAAKVVFTAINTTRDGSAPANRMAPAVFRPNQPTSDRKHANRTTTASCPSTAE